ncbi:MAG: NAD(P)H-hydrate dehydratase [Acidiferrobacterales bacterium]
MLKSNSQPDSLYSAEQARELDRIAMTDFGLKDGVLMERAGLAAFQLLRFCWPRARKLLVVAGPGNNGGDGFVLARLAITLGYKVKLIATVAPDHYKGDAGKALKGLQESLQATGGTILNSIHELETDTTYSGRADVIVDAMFGIGLDRQPGGDYLAIINWINDQDSPVLAIDIPSGLHADTGSILEQAVQANATISFIGLKTGLVTGRGPQVCGQLYFHDLDLPQAVYENIEPVARTVSVRNISHLPFLQRDTHKARQGHVLVLGGDKSMAGAAAMAGQAAYRCGAGLVRVLCHETSLTQVSFSPEIMVTGTSDKTPIPKNVFAKANALVLGPGLGQRPWGLSLFSKALDQESLPMVVDADGLRWLAANPQYRHNWVLTPHAGEAAALLGVNTIIIESDRLLAARQISEKYGGSCILKGAGSVITDAAEDQVRIVRAGNPGMATGGMGDVLSGIIAALMGLGLSPFNSAVTGAWIHGNAADQAAIVMGERGLMATDLFKTIPEQMARLEQN